METFAPLINTQLKIGYAARDYAQYIMIPSQFPFEDVYYWAKIPDYTIAQCPICTVPYIQAVDTHNLYWWSIRHNMECVSWSMKGYQRCEHFVGVHTFLNLNQQFPLKKELHAGYIHSSEPEIPIITPSLLPDNTESYVVLHSIPIARINEEEFIPTYTLYMLTYYSTEPKSVEESRMMEWTSPYRFTKHIPWGSTMRMGIYWEEANEKLEAWDLGYWINKGKLYWLDVTHPDLPLSQDKKKFPYHEIRGVKHGYIYQNRKYKPLSTQYTIEYFRSQNLRQYLWDLEGIDISVRV